MLSAPLYLIHISCSRNSHALRKVSLASPVPRTTMKTGFDARRSQRRSPPTRDFWVTYRPSCLWCSGISRLTASYGCPVMTRKRRINYRCSACKKSRVSREVPKTFHVYDTIGDWSVSPFPLLLKYVYV